MHNSLSLSLQTLAKNQFMRKHPTETNQCLHAASRFSFCWLPCHTLTKYIEQNNININTVSHEFDRVSII